MGTQNIPQADDGVVIPASDHNSIRNALIGDLVPRNTSGNATDEAGSLGTSTYQFKDAKIKNGYLSVGDIKPHHSFNNLVKCGQGWFPCNGQVINETNYDAYHGAGSWDQYIVSSVLDGKYAPNLSNKYLVGVGTTTQTGSSAITGVGNTSHQINLQHNHSVSAHVHQWYDNSNSTGSDKTYDASGSQINIATTTPIKSDPALGIIGVGGGNNPSLIDSYTSSAGGGSTGNGLSSTQNIQPESIQVEYYIRIVG